MDKWLGNCIFFYICFPYQLDLYIPPLLCRKRIEQISPPRVRTYPFRTHPGAAVMRSGFRLAAPTCGPWRPVRCSVGISAPDIALINRKQGVWVLYTCYIRALPSEKGASFQILQKLQTFGEFESGHQKQLHYKKYSFVTFPVIAPYYYFSACWEPWSRRCGWRL